MKIQQHLLVKSQLIVSLGIFIEEWCAFFAISKLCCACESWQSMILIENYWKQNLIQHMATFPKFVSRTGMFSSQNWIPRSNKQRDCAQINSKTVDKTSVLKFGASGWAGTHTHCVVSTKMPLAHRAENALLFCLFHMYIHWCVRVAHRSDNMCPTRATLNVTASSERASACNTCVRLN